MNQVDARAWATRVDEIDTKDTKHLCALGVSFVTFVVPLFPIECLDSRLRGNDNFACGENPVLHPRRAMDESGCPLPGFQLRAVKGRPDLSLFALRPPRGG